MPGAVWGTGPADGGGVCFVYHFRNYSFNHRARNSKRRDLSGILLWVVGRKEFFISGSRRVDSCPHQKSTHRSGVPISQRRGRAECGGWEGPRSQIWQEAEDTTPPVGGGERSMNQCQTLPLNSIWQHCGCFHSIYLFIYFLRKEEVGGGGREHKLLLSISIMFHVCKALLSSLSPELPEIIKAFENPAKNSKYWADRYKNLSLPLVR